MKKLLGFLSGAVMGGLVGATLALLLAPSSGDELRGQLHDRYGAFQSEIKQAMDAKRIELEGKLEDLRKPVVKVE
jgi:gas vesicle protein